MYILYQNIKSYNIHAQHHHWLWSSPPHRGRWDGIQPSWSTERSRAASSDCTVSGPDPVASCSWPMKKKPSLLENVDSNINYILNLNVLTTEQRKKNIITGKKLLLKHCKFKIHCIWMFLQLTIKKSFLLLKNCEIYCLVQRFCSFLQLTTENKKYN